MFQAKILSSIGGRWIAAYALLISPLLTVAEPLSVSPPTAPVKVIFFIHGLNSNPGAFCDLPEMVKTSLENEFPNLANDVHVFAPVYDSKGNDHGTAREFAIGPVAKQMRDYYAKNNININEPYAIVAHSQGGLVASFLSFLCIRGETISHTDEEEAAACRTSSMPKNLVKVVTLGTPFWGSSIASASDRIKALAPGPLERVLKKILPADQIASMSYGSPQNSDLRWIYMGKNPYGDEQPEPQIVAHLNGPFPAKTETFNVSGIFRYAKSADYSWAGSPIVAFEHLIEGGMFGRETDFAVDVSAARPDFNYWVEGNPRIPNQKTVAGTTNVALGRFITTNLPHIPMGGSESISCVKNRSGYKGMSESNHPVFQLLKLVLAGRELTTNDVERLSSGLPIIKNFMSQVTINLPRGYQRPILDQRFLTTDVLVSESTNGSYQKIDTLYIGDTPTSRYTRVDDGPSSVLYFNNPDVQMYQTFSHQGRFKESYGYQPEQTPYQETLYRRALHKTPGSEDHPEVWSQGATDPAHVNYTFKIPGWFIKKVDVRVNPTFSTYIEVYASPQFPLPTVHGVRGAQQSFEAEAARLFSVNYAELYLLNSYKVPQPHIYVATQQQTEPLIKITLMRKENLDSPAQPFEVTLPQEGAITADQAGLDVATLKKLRRRALDPKVFNRCYLGRVGRLNGDQGGIHTGILFTSFYDFNTRSESRLSEGDIVEIRARYDEPSRNLDRYLVAPLGGPPRLALKDFRWVNVKDIDWVGTQPCRGIVPARGVLDFNSGAVRYIEGY